MDDRWASVGSDNFNRRSWTHDSELSAVVVDESRSDYNAWARRLRLTLAAEHLDREIAPGTDDDGLAELMADCLTPEGMLATYRASAERLQAWHDGGRRGTRPPGRLREQAPVDLSLLQRLWATPIYELVHDPDGRPAPLRRRHEF